MSVTDPTSPTPPSGRAPLSTSATSTGGICGMRTSWSCQVDCAARPPANVISDSIAHDSPHAVPPSMELAVMSGSRTVPGSTAATMRWMVIALSAATDSSTTWAMNV